MNFSKKMLLLCSLMVSMSSAFALNISRFESESCPRTLIALRSGRYLTRPALVYQGDGDLAVLQKVGAGAHAPYIYFDSQKTITLYKDIQRARDFITYRDFIWVLGDSSLFQFNRGGELVRTYTNPTSSRYGAPKGMTLYNDKLLIAYGDLGLVSFDFTSLQFTLIHGVNTRQTDGKESMTTSVTVLNDVAYVSLTGLQQGAFNGIVAYDLNTSKILNTAKYRNYREGVIDPTAKIYHFNGDIYLNNGGWIHRHLVKNLLSKSIARPKWLSISREVDGMRSYPMISGDFIFSNQEILGCGQARGKTFVVQTKI